MADVSGEIATYLQAEAVTKAPELSWRKHRRPMLLAIALAGSISSPALPRSFFNYLNDMPAAAGFDNVSADRQAIVIGTCNLFFTSVALTVINRVGRKTLLLMGSVGLTVALAGVAYIFSVGVHQDRLLWLLIGFIACFAFSHGAVIWVHQVHRC